MLPLAAAQKTNFDAIDPKLASTLDSLPDISPGSFVLELLTPNTPAACWQHADVETGNSKASMYLDNVAEDKVLPRERAGMAAALCVASLFCLE